MMFAGSVTALEQSLGTEKMRTEESINVLDIPALTEDQA